MDPSQQVARLFDAVADSYDAVGVEFFGPIAEGLVAALAPQRGERALDVGCGRGAVLFRLAEAVGEDGSVTGIDVSPRMVELTTAQAAEVGVEVDVRVGDAMAPDLAAGAHDLVASSLVLFFLPDPLVALQRWRDLLTDGGRIGVATFGPYSPQWLDTVDAALQAHSPPELADARTSGRSGPFAFDAAMEQLLDRAGFRDVRTITATVSPRFDDPEHWFRWSMSVGQRRFWQSLPADRAADIRAEILAAVERCRDDDGRIGFDQQVRYTIGRH